MNFGEALRGWLGAWLVSAGLYLALVVVVVLHIFPSRSDIEGAWLRKAIAIEKQFDFSLRKMNAPQLKSRYAGMTRDAAVAQIRGKLFHKPAEPAAAGHRLGVLLPESTGSGGLLRVSAVSRPVDEPLNQYSRTAPRKTDGTLVWLDDAMQPTEDSVARLKTEFEQLDRRHQDQLNALPGQVAKALAFGFLLGLVPMGIAFLLIVLMRRSAAGAATQAVSLKQVASTQSVNPEQQEVPADAAPATGVVRPAEHSGSVKEVCIGWLNAAGWVLQARGMTNRVAHS